MSFLQLIFVCFSINELQAQKTFMNPVDLSYRFVIENRSSSDTPHREAADPSMIFFKNEFYLFPSKSGGYYHSVDMIAWDLIETKDIVPIETYAPTAVVIDNGSAVLWMTSGDARVYRSTDPKAGRWELVTSSFPQKETDPALLYDDGRLYWYGGSSSSNPIYAVEVDLGTFRQVGTRVSVISKNEEQLGWEVWGDTNQGGTCCSWLEGSWASKINGRYYLEYSDGDTEQKSYCSGVYTASSPLGPYTLQNENPMTIKESGFACGAGHGSIFTDRWGNLWHVSTVAIGVRAQFERRLQINPLFLDADAALWGYTGWADWPKKVPAGKLSGPEDLDTESVLLSHGKKGSASSTQSGHAVELALNEDIRTWWSATSNASGQWYQVDLGTVCDIAGVHVNFGDHDSTLSGRHNTIYYQYVLEVSADNAANGTTWTVLKNYSTQTADHPHQYTEAPAGTRARHVRITNLYTPSGKFSLSGLRVFGLDPAAAKPAAPTGIKGTRLSDRRGVRISWNAVAGAAGYNVRFGTAAGKLYQNHIVYGATEVEIRYLNTKLEYWFTVDVYSEGGLTQGKETVAVA